MKEVRKPGSEHVLIQKIVSASFAVIVWILLSTLPVYAQQLDDSGVSDMTGQTSFGSRLGPEQLPQQLGISMPQLQQMGEKGSEGGIGKADYEKLCASIAAKHMSPEEAESIGHSLGFQMMMSRIWPIAHGFRSARQTQSALPQNIRPGQQPLSDFRTFKSLGHQMWKRHSTPWIHPTKVLLRPISASSISSDTICSPQEHR